MDEFIDNIRQITNLSELKNIDSIDSNTLIYAIDKSRRYDLFNGTNIRLNLKNNETLEEVIDFLLSDEDEIYFMKKNGFKFTDEELNTVLYIVYKKYENSYKFEQFFTNFFNIDELDLFINKHKQFFESYVSKKKEDISFVPRRLLDCDNFIELILKENIFSLIKNIEDYSSSNLKLLAECLKQNCILPYYFGNDRFATHIFELKKDLTIDEFGQLLSLFKDKNLYNRLDNLISENIDYLIDVVSTTKTVPKCLIESSVFRDECIKRNRIDIASKCILPSYITQNENLVNAYCKELNIAPKDFYERYKWVSSYYEKNNNIFNTLISTSLKDNIFNLNKEHYERFINDTEVQMALSKLNDKELLVLSKILNVYNYKDYDVSSMVMNIINNVGNYQELIASLDIDNIKEQDIRQLVKVLQIPNNQYRINSIESLQNYDAIKKEYFEKNFYEGNLTSNKDNLLKLLFNIDLEEACYINSKYCCDKYNNEIFNKLENSELPKDIFNYLLLVNNIIKCDNLEDLSNLYRQIGNNKVYTSEMQLESYLRSKYTELYSKSIYKIDERNQIYGPKDNIYNKVSYNGKDISICIPRANFNFFIHTVGTCSTAENENYKIDWCDRPQIQDHFVACSYINEKGINSIRTGGKIILGFDSLENGSILCMGDSDIDSIGYYSNLYAGSRILQEENGSRTKFFVPSHLLETINDSYNEVVIERRNINLDKKEEFKRRPDYIIMMTEAINQTSFNYLENLYQNQLTFLSEDDKNEIKQNGDLRKIKEILKKYKDIISQNTNLQGDDLKNMFNTYIDLIMKAKYFEDCLKASSEFDIPLVVVDKTYYFNKILIESSLYDDETINSILDFYSKSSELQQKQMFNMIAKGENVLEMIKSKNIDNNKIV